MNGWLQLGVKLYTFHWWRQLIRTDICGFYLQPLQMSIYFSSEKVLSDTGRGTVDGIFWRPLLFQILKPADSSKLLLPVFLSVHILILIVSLFPLPFPAVPSFRHLKSPYYFLFKLRSHRGYWYSHPSSLTSRMMNDILNYPSPEMVFLFEQF